MASRPAVPAMMRTSSRCPDSAGPAIAFYPAADKVSPGVQLDLSPCPARPARSGTRPIVEQALLLRLRLRFGFWRRFGLRRGLGFRLDHTGGTEREAHHHAAVGKARPLA